MSDIAFEKLNASSFYDFYSLTVYLKILPETKSKKVMVMFSPKLTNKML